MTFDKLANNIQTIQDSLQRQAVHAVNVALTSGQ